MIYPYLSYCNIVCDSASDAALHKLFVLQKRAARFIAGYRRRSLSGPIFARLHLLKLSNNDKFLIAQFMFKTKHSQFPLSCMNNVTTFGKYWSYS